MERMRGRPRAEFGAFRGEDTGCDRPPRDSPCARRSSARGARGTDKTRGRLRRSMGGATVSPGRPGWVEEPHALRRVAARLADATRTRLVRAAGVARVAVRPAPSDAPHRERRQGSTPTVKGD